MNHGARQHAAWSASASARLWACPGSLALSAGVEEDAESVFAAWGTACHQVAEMCLRGGLGADHWLGRTIPTKEHHFVFDEEMADCTQEFLDYVRGRLADYRQAQHYDGIPARHQHDATLLIEQRFDLSPINPPFEAGGTGDAVMLFPAWGLIEIVDLKTGRGIVEAEGNKQLRTYALGALLANPGPWDRVQATIVQPRAAHRDGRIRSETVDRLDLYEWTIDLKNAMAAAAEAASALEHTVPPPMWARDHLNPGDHCTFCPARPTCPALQTAALAAAQTRFGPAGRIETPPDPASLPVEKIVAVLDAADMIGSWLDAVRARAHRLVEAGETVGDYILVPKRATRKWKDDAIAKLRKSFPEHMFTVEKEVSPAQAEKILGAKYKTFLSDFWTAESTGTNLVRADKTQREALPPPAQRAAQTFGEIKDHS